MSDMLTTTGLPAPRADSMARRTRSDPNTDPPSVHIVYIDGDEGSDGLYWGLGAIQRIGQTNTTFRIVGSEALDEPSSAVSSGSASARLFCSVGSSAKLNSCHFLQRSGTSSS